MLSEPVDGVSAIATVTDVNCYGEATGAITLSVSGGMEPYQFVWSNGIDTRDLIDLVAGSYQVNITEATGCSFAAEYIVSEPAAAQVPRICLIWRQVAIKSALPMQMAVLLKMNLQ